MMAQQSCTLAVLLLSVLGSTTAVINLPPRITKQPPTDELLFKEGSQSFIIECAAEGKPQPTYRWMKNGKDFDTLAHGKRISQQPGQGTLVITFPTAQDGGQYQCFAANEFGTATSNSVFVRKAELNGFEDGATRTVVANEGEPFSLQCKAPDGWPKPTLNWLLQSIDGSISVIKNSRITLDPAGTLWFSSVARKDASVDFYYICTATSHFRNEYKIVKRVLLRVKETGVNASQQQYPAKRQYVTPKDIVALRGKRVELFCIYGGTPLPQIVWSKNFWPIRWSDRITQAHYGKSLVLRDVNFDDEGSYTCDTSNGLSAVQSHSITLKILATPYFTVEPESKEAAEDEAAVFRCEAAGRPEPTIQWIYNGKPIEQSAPNSRRIVQRNRIIIYELVKGDTGNYGCNASNALGYVYKDVYLNVLASPPEILEAPRKEVSIVGKNITMHCHVFGAPKPQVKWLRNGLDLTGERYTVWPTGDLEIQQVSFSDAGDYMCYAMNKFGSKSATGSLTVKPWFYERAAGQSATFHCNVTHDYRAWWKDSQNAEQCNIRQTILYPMRVQQKCAVVQAVAEVKSV